MVWMRRPRWVERGVQVQARVQGRVCQEPSTLEPRLEVGWGRTHTRHSPLAGGQVAEFRVLVPPWCLVPLKGCDTWPHGLTWRVGSGQCHTGPEAAAARVSSA